MGKRIFHLHVWQYLYPLVFAVVCRDALGKGREEAGKTGFAMEGACEQRIIQIEEKTVAVRQFPQHVTQCLDFIGDFDTIIVGATALLPPLNLGQNYRCLFPDNVVS